MNRYLLLISLLSISGLGYGQGLPPDSTFGVNGFTAAAVTPVLTAEVQPDGKIVAISRGNIFRLGEFIAHRYKTNGKVDSTFGQNGKSIINIQWNSATRDIKFQSDGKIVLLFDRRNDSLATAAIVRLNGDGSVDRTFGTSGLLTVLYGRATPTSGVYFGTVSFALQKDNKIVLVVPDYLIPGSAYIIRRFMTDGTPDLSFAASGVKKVETSAGSYIAFTSNVLVQDDGKIVMVGSMLQDYVTTIVRCKPDGQYDSSFNGTGRVNNMQIGDVRAIAKQTDGKILLAAADVSATRIARYNTNGTIDNTYGSSGYSFTRYVVSNAWSSVNDLKVQLDGKIITSSVYMRASPAYLYEAGALRYTTNGVLDTTFASAGKFLNIPTGSGMLLSPRNERIYFFSEDSIVAYKSGIVLPCLNDITPPKITCVPTINFKHVSRYYSIGRLTATDNCGIRSIVYEMSGATSRRGSGYDASGELKKGVTYLKWTVTDSAGNTSTCTTVITVLYHWRHGNLEVSVYPNPSTNYFMVTAKSADTKHRVLLRVFTSYGRLVEIRWIYANEPVQIGRTYRRGRYYLYFNQAGKKAVVVAYKLGS